MCDRSNAVNQHDRELQDIHAEAYEALNGLVWVFEMIFLGKTSPNTPINTTCINTLYLKQFCLLFLHSYTHTHRELKHYKKVILQPVLLDKFASKMMYLNTKVKTLQ